ncbi:PIN domain-containing protein [Polaromonas sp.]|uniref:PIN domain-containing protein n=1 Tax=Polaromonas sp. TaxID=1869339 RepID=UPI002FCA01E0
MTGSILTPLLLDTNIISDMMRDLQGPAARRAMAADPSSASRPLYTSAVVQCELEYGLARRKNARLEVAYQGVMATVEVLPITSDVAEHYARLRTQLEALGQPIGPNDALIAAHALALDATLVSADAEFRRVPGLRVENWLEPENTAK